MRRTVFRFSGAGLSPTIGSCIGTGTGRFVLCGEESVVAVRESVPAPGSSGADRDSALLSSVKLPGDGDFDLPSPECRRFAALRWLTIVSRLVDGPCLTFGRKKAVGCAHIMSRLKTGSDRLSGAEQGAVLDPAGFGPRDG